MRRFWGALWLATLLAVSAQAGGPKVLVLGFDGMDPVLLAQFRA